MDTCKQWTHFIKHYQLVSSLGISVDSSRVPELEPGKIPQIQLMRERAKEEMASLEKGAIANPDEDKMVGHYWLRTPELAPEKNITAMIQDTLGQIVSFAEQVHEGSFYVSGGSVESVLLIGIGGSALGPQLLDTLYQDKIRLPLYVMDNTDPDGIQMILKKIPALSRTLVIVVSKSGGTRETRNGMLATEAYFKSRSIPFSEHAIAVTGEGSNLFMHAKKQSWRKIFPIWDWVGGRTSVWSAVGLLPAALQGIDVQSFLKGAALMDEATRGSAPEDDVALRMAESWYILGNGKGDKAMVVLPYRDRLLLLGKYLQQLVMESLGKYLDRDDEVVCQGLTVYGNKGSTDQHSYIQQLRDGIPNYFAVFVEVLKDKESWTAGEIASLTLDDEASAGDYLQGFLLGTCQALSERNRSSLSIALPDCSEQSVGALLALFERAVGYYASMINVNAYHQPGVEAGKKAAVAIVELIADVRSASEKQANPFTLDDLFDALTQKEHSKEVVFKVMQRMLANGELQVLDRGPGVSQWQYRVTGD